MRTQATFRIAGTDGRTSAHVTDLLGLVPTLSREAGSPISTQSEATYDESLWFLSSAVEPQDDVELSVQLGILFDQLDPVASRLWDLVDAGYWANWFCYLGSHATEHAAQLDRLTMTRLLALPGDLWIDLYPSEPDDDGTSPISAATLVTPAGPCRHCGYQTVYAGIRLLHARPDGGPGNRQCRANLFYFDEERWLENPPQLRNKAAELRRSKS